MGTLFLSEILLAIIVFHAICYGQECDPNGISCINCTDYQECSGGAPKGPIFSCKNGIKCGEQPLLKHCWSKLNCYDLNECTEVGIFPDATSESNYFVCLPDSGSGFVKYDFTCPQGEFFDKTARMCIASDVTSTSTLPPSIETTVTATSSTPEPTTQTPATTNSVTTSETTTTTQTPATTISVTTSETTTTTQTPATTISVTTSETTTAVPTAAPTSSPPFSCTSPGIFPNLTNCKMYLRCSTSLKAFSYTCPGTSYFNENILKCSLIITSSCQQQILQNATTPTTLMTTSTTTTTPVPSLPPTTTTNAPAPPITAATTSSTKLGTAGTTLAPTITTTQALSTPFSCSAAGTFENPVDCKTYYRCGSSGKTFLYTCPNGSYYNEVTKRCGLTITPKCRSKL